jgi:predicted Zn-dependent protease
MREFSKADECRFQSAVGWLELGNWREANEEIENLSPKCKLHPEVLQVRCKIYHDAGKWDYMAEVANGLCTMLPDSAFGPVHLSHALRRLDRSKDARDALLPIADKFPNDWHIPFHLACCCCKIGERKEAFDWVARAIDVAGKADIRMQALEEKDLEPMWLDISGI